MFRILVTTHPSERSRPNGVHPWWWTVTILKKEPFGLTGAPSTFRKLMVKKLDGPANALVYRVHITIFSASAAELSVPHGDNTATCKTNWSQNQPCEISTCKDVNGILWHKMGRGRIEPPPGKPLFVRQFSIMKSKRNLLQVLDRVEFYRRFIQNFHIFANSTYD